MNVSERVLTILKNGQWWFMSEIIAKMPKTKKNSIRMAVHYSLEEKRIKKRAKISERTCGAIHNTTQYIITVKGRRYLNREKKTIKV